MSLPSHKMGNAESKPASDSNAGARKRQPDEPPLRKRTTASLQGLAPSGHSKPRSPTKRRTDDVNHAQGPPRKVPSNVLGDVRSQQKSVSRPVKAESTHARPTQNGHVDSAEESDEIVVNHGPPSQRSKPVKSSSKHVQANGLNASKASILSAKVTSSSAAGGETALPDVSSELKKTPHAFVPSSRLPPSKKTLTQLRQWASEFQPLTSCVDKKGYYIFFEDNGVGHRDLDRCCRKRELLLNKHEVRPEPRHHYPTKARPLESKQKAAGSSRLVETKTKDAERSRPPSSGGLTSASESSLNKACRKCKQTFSLTPAFKCTTCDRRWHSACHIKPRKPDAENVQKDWQCKVCIKNGVPPLKHQTPSTLGASQAEPSKVKEMIDTSQAQDTPAESRIVSSGPIKSEHGLGQVANEPQSRKSQVDDVIPKTKALDAIQEQLDRRISSQPPKSDSPRAVISGLLRNGTSALKSESERPAQPEAQFGPTGASKDRDNDDTLPTETLSMISQEKSITSIPDVARVDHPSRCSPLHAATLQTADGERHSGAANRSPHLHGTEVHAVSEVPDARPNGQDMVSSGSHVRSAQSVLAPDQALTQLENARPIVAQKSLAQSSSASNERLESQIPSARPTANTTRNSDDTPATAYLKKVQLQLGDNVYSRFRDLIYEGKVQDEWDMLEFGVRAIKMFAGHKDIVEGLNLFLSDHYKVQYGTDDDPDAVRLLTAGGHVVRVVPGPKNMETVGSDRDLPVVEPMAVDRQNATSTEDKNADGNAHLENGPAAESMISGMAVEAAAVPHSDVAPLSTLQTARAVAAEPRDVQAEGSTARREVQRSAVGDARTHSGSSLAKIAEPADNIRGVDSAMPPPGPGGTTIDHSMSDTSNARLQQPTVGAEETHVPIQRPDAVQRLFDDVQSYSTPTSPSSGGSPAADIGEPSIRPARLTAKRTKSKPKILLCQDCGKKIVQHTEQTGGICSACQMKRESGSQKLDGSGLDVQTENTLAGKADAGQRSPVQNVEDVKMTGMEAGADRTMAENAKDDETDELAKSPPDISTNDIETPTLTPAKQRKTAKSKETNGDTSAKDATKKRRIMKIGGTALGDSKQRPKGTYEILIGLAMSTTPDHRMQCRGVCHWIATNIETYQHGVDQWESGIGATLSIHEGIKSKQLWDKVDWVEGESDEFGKGCWYTLKPGKAETLARWDPVTKSVIWPPGKEPKEATTAETASTSTTPKKPKERKQPEALAAEQTTIRRKTSLGDTPIKASKKGLSKEGTTNKVSREKEVTNGVPTHKTQDQPPTTTTTAKAKVETVSPSRPRGDRMASIRRPTSLPILPVKQASGGTSLLELVKREATNVAYSVKSLWDEWPELDPQQGFDTEAKMTEIKQRPSRKQMFKSNSLYSRLGRQNVLEEGGNVSGIEQASRDGAKPSSRRELHLFPQDDHNREFKTVEEFLGLPNNPVPTLRSGNWGYRDGTRDEMGNLGRARNVYPTGL